MPVDAVCHLFPSCLFISVPQSCVARESAAESNPWEEPAGAPFTLIPCRTGHAGRTRAAHRGYGISAGQRRQLLAAKTAATPPLPATPLAAQADELCLGELPRCSDAASLQSFKPSISQVAINGKFLTNLKPSQAKLMNARSKREPYFQYRKYYIAWRHLSGKAVRSARSFVLLF